MKKNFYLLVFLFPVYFLLSNSGGAPYGYSGSGGDNGRTCTYCHSANGASYTPSIALQNFPATYVPGQTYRIHLTVSGTSNSKFGFEATVENSSNQKQGTFSGVSGYTQAIHSNTYITHVAGQTGAGDWLFDWTAPAAGQGNLKMFYAINLANGNGQSTGDYIVNDFAEMQEDTSEISEIKEGEFVLFPNPAGDFLHLNNINLENYTLQAVDIQGRIYPLKNIANTIDVSFLPTGTYVLQLNLNNVSYVKQFVKK